MKKQTGDQDFANKEKSLGVAQENHKKIITTHNLVISKQKVPKKSWSDFFSKINMISKLLPNNATHSSLNLFEKPALLVTFDGSFCQKMVPVYSHDGPMLEFEVIGDRNNFIDIQKIFSKSNAK